MLDDCVLYLSLESPEECLSPQNSPAISWCTREGRIRVAPGSVTLDSLGHRHGFTSNAGGRGCTGRVRPTFFLCERCRIRVQCVDQFACDGRISASNLESPPPPGKLVVFGNVGNLLRFTVHGHILLCCWVAGRELSCQGCLLRHILLGTIDTPIA